MDIKEQIKNIKTQLRLAMNGPVSQSMRESGFSYKLNFGVELPRIKSIAAGYEQNSTLALELWKEDIRECKILASLLMPVDTFFMDMAELWVEQIDNIEIAQLTVMNLFQKLPYAPALSFKWISDDREFVQTCGFLVIARLLMQKGDMDERSGSEFLDQAICAAVSGKYNVRSAALLAIKKYMNNEEQSFKVCRMVEHLTDSKDENELILYNMVREKVNEG